MKLRNNSYVLSQCFSIIFPVYNEEKVIKQNAKKLYFYLKNVGFKKFEILLCDNASTDNTGIISKNLTKEYPEIRYVFTNKKGIGAGIKAGIKASKFNILIMMSIDLAFEPKYVFESIQALYSKKADIIIGSKRHNKSKVKRPFSRKVASFAYNTLVNALFGIKIFDTQGVVTFKKTSIMTFLNTLSSNDSFFQTQFVIYSKANNLRIIEIPVNVIDTRNSSFNIKSEAFNLFIKLVKEFFIIRLSSFKKHFSVFFFP